jgi:hypothetical protein
LRVRNLALVIAPAAAMGTLALALQERVDGRLAAAAIALAIVPAPLAGPELVSRMRGRADLAGVLVLGTVLASLLVVGSRGALAAGALFAAGQAFALSSMLASALPGIRDALLVPLRVLGWTALVVIVVSAVAAQPPLALQSVVVALALLVVGAGTSAAVARAFDRDVRGAVAGAGLRDPALAVVFASIVGADAGVALAYAALVVCLCGIALLRA